MKERNKYKKQQQQKKQQIPQTKKCCFGVTSFSVFIKGACTGSSDHLVSLY